MQGLLQTALDRALVGNEKALNLMNNAADRLFRSDQLVLANRTPHEVIHQRDLLTVRYYPPLAESSIEVAGETIKVATHQHKVPIVMVPPLAASTLVFDLLPQRSLVKFMLAQGYPVYLVDWGEPERDHSHLRIKDYVNVMLPEALAKIREHGEIEDITLLGWCMGGLFSLMYAGLAQDEHVRNIVTVASPIDSHQGTMAGGLLRVLNPAARLVRKYTNFRIHNIDPKYLQIPGWANVLMFKATNPIGSLTTYWDLLTNLWDREFVEVHTTTSKWLDNMFDYPGGIVQDFFIKVGVDNDLAKGQIEYDDEKATFEKIRCSILAIAGETDAIVKVEGARQVLDLVSSDDKEFVIAPGGHAGVFGGGKAPKFTWKIAADWLRTRSD